MHAERGNTKHGPQLDEQLEQETRGMVQGHGGSPHVEPFRESEPLPDDTDDPEVERAYRGGAGKIDETGQADGVGGVDDPDPAGRPDKTEEDV